MADINVQKFTEMTDGMGGPAFPFIVPSQTDTKTGAVLSFDIFPGMTLRDWFAGLAMSGMLGGVPGSHLRPLADGIGKEAYDTADAMLAARKVGA